MNPLCDNCDGFCSRHQMKKTNRERQFCRGEANTSDQGYKYWLAWEEGRSGATAPETPAPSLDEYFGVGEQAKEEEEVRDKSSVGDCLHEIIFRETGHEIPCEQCAKEIRELNRLDVLEASHQRERIVDSIYSRSWGHASWADKLKLIASAAVSAASLGHVALAKGVIGDWFDEAIKAGVFPKETHPSKKRGRRHASLVPVRPVVVAGRSTYPRLSYSPNIPDTPIPFTADPSLTLLFHVWPFGEGWREHAERLRPLLHKFDRKILGIAVDPSTYTAAEVAEVFGDEWEVVEAINVPDLITGLREVATYRKMLPMLPQGQNDVTFCAHAKGAQAHTASSETVEWWIDAMYETILCNTQGVIRAMRDGASIVGSFRRHGRNLGVKHLYHFSGTYYGFRNCIAFNNGIPSHREKWWGTESWPGDHFPKASAHCIFGENSGDMYFEENQQRAELEAWKAANPNRT